MQWSEWKPLYRGIVDRLHLDPANDIRATEILTEILAGCEPEPLLARLDSMIRNRTVVVFGAGPSLERHISVVEAAGIYDDATFMAADGALRALLHFGMRCDVVVTDLDGVNNDSLSHALVVVHAHGDNIPQIQERVPRLGCVLGSTQVEPTDRAFLWGGFTDGDRACHVCACYRPKRIVLAGMDFGDTVGKWSKPYYTSDHLADDRKREKLQIAYDLVSRLRSRTNLEFLVLK